MITKCARLRSGKKGLTSMDTDNANDKLLKLQLRLAQLDKKTGAKMIF